MGSKPRHSSRRRKAGSSTPRKPKSSAAPRRSPTDFDALLGRFSDALSILASATRALNTIEGHIEHDPDHDVSEDIYTLEHGLTALRAVYNELDVAIMEVRP